MARCANVSMCQRCRAKGKKTPQKTGIGGMYTYACTDRVSQRVACFSTSHGMGVRGRWGGSDARTGERPPATMYDLLSNDFGLKAHCDPINQDFDDDVFKLPLKPQIKSKHDTHTVRTRCSRPHANASRVQRCGFAMCDVWRPGQPRALCNWQELWGTAAFALR